MFLDNIKLINDKIRQIIKQLTKIYDVYIVDETKIINLEHRAKQLQTDFPFLKENHFIFCKDKSLIEGDILIDDNLEALRRFKQKNLNSLTFCINQPYNNKQKAYVDFKFNSLEEAVKYLNLLR